MAEAKAIVLETDFVKDLDPQVYSSLRAALRDVSLICISTTKIHLLQSIFKQGERSGRLLAWLSQENSSPVSISQIQSSTGNILTDPMQINAWFASHYQEQYSSRVLYTEGEMHEYLAQVDLPCLTDSSRERLDSPLTLNEIQSAVKSLQGGNTPGMDGYPIEIF